MPFVMVTYSLSVVFWIEITKCYEALRDAALITSMMLLKSSDPPEANITLAKFSYACMSFKSWEVLKTMTHCIIRCLLHKSQLIGDQCSHFLLARYYFFLQDGTYVSAIKFVIACGYIYDLV